MVQVAFHAGRECRPHPLTRYRRFWITPPVGLVEAEERLWRMQFASGTAQASYGDRIAAMREMLTGGELDYLTGITWPSFRRCSSWAATGMKNPDGGYAKTFLRQLRSRWAGRRPGVKIVANAGGLNPAGLADAVRQLASRLGLTSPSPTSRATTSRPRRRAGTRRATDRQRLSGRLGHRGLP